MGACYYVILKVKVRDEQCAITALNRLIKKDINTNYSLNRYAEQGIKTEKYDDLMRIFLASWKGQEMKIRDVDDCYKTYENSFNASYGWEIVMIEAFEILSSYLDDGSELLIYPDQGYDKMVVKNGKCVQVH